MLRRRIITNDASELMGQVQGLNDIVEKLTTKAVFRISNPCMSTYGICKYTIM